MSNTDQELFDLCRQVYEATGWCTEMPGIEKYFAFVPQLRNTKRDFRDKYKLITIEQATVDYGQDFDTDTANFTPLYTSDYLLEKLPQTVNDKDGNWQQLNMSHDNPKWNDDKEWLFRYGRDNIIASARADTPLKSLLRLTLALKKEGLL